MHHKTLEAYLASSPVAFAPCNGCLSDKQNRALSLTLAAAFLAHNEGITENAEPEGTEGWPVDGSVDAFRDAVTQHLISLGVSSPLLGIKQGGVGEYLPYISAGFHRSRRGRCPATISVLGALASQETIKAITGVHTPLQQMMFFESLDSLGDFEEEEELKTGVDEKGLSNMELVYGRRTVERLRRLQLFLVGAGAIGCELLKNFALMEVSCVNGKDATPSSARVMEASLWNLGRLKSSRGGIVVADMDTIEKSNLNRQLLFRPQHIGASKAETAANMIGRINPSIRVLGVNQRVGDTASSPFNASFWREVDLVITALDNVDARRFVDGECVRRGLALLDSGTQGTRGNTQVILPHLTESYASTSDPIDDAIPLCTLKSFPYLPEHCVAWSKSLFEAHFSEDVNRMRTILEALAACRGDEKKYEDFLATAPSLNEEEAQRFIELVEVIIGRLTPKAWAKRLFRRLFVTEIEQLIAQHPKDEIDETGVPFWSGSRKFPVPQALLNESASSEFVSAAAQLVSRSLGIHLSGDLRYCRDVSEGGSARHESSVLGAFEDLYKKDYTELTRLSKSLAPESFDKVKLTQILSSESIIILIFLRMMWH